MDNPAPMFEKFVLLLNEDKPGSERPVTARNSVENLDSIMSSGSLTENEPLITRLGKLLMGKIRAHSSLEPELFTPDEILKKHGESLAPVMYRIATEGFVKASKSPFKLIECRNITKLASDWKPSLPDLFISLGHQVILVELKESFGPYNDFVYAVLRQMNYDWKIRLPRSFFYPDDVCTTIATADEQLILITPSMPDGEMEFSDRVRNSLQYDILMMLKASCESAMENHLLMRDLRVGKFAETFDGVTSIRNVYRSLQERLKDGRDMSLGRSSEELNLFLLSGAGDMILSAEALLDACKKLGLKEEELEIEKTLQLASLAEENSDLCPLKNEGSDVSNYDRKDKNGFQVQPGACCGEAEISLEPKQLETPVLQIQQVLTQNTQE